jgi:hypothetical protein
VIKVIEPLEETAGQMVMVTEPVFGSLANLLGQFRDVPTAPQDRAGAVLSPLEIKYGLHTLAETLHFLHHEARLVHCNINPGRGPGVDDQPVPYTLYPTSSGHFVAAASLCMLHRWCIMG